MDSGNSGSLQSSSGEEEFDSRAADTISAAMMNNSNNNHRTGGAPVINGPISNQPPPLPLSSAMFDSLSSSFLFDNPMSRPFQHHHNHNQNQSSNNNNSVLSLDMAAWSKTLIRSEPNCTDNINSSTNSVVLLPTSCSSSSSTLQSLFAHQGQLQNPPTVSTIHHPSPVVVVAPENSSSSATNTPTGATTAAPDHQPQTHAPRNPKKRSRASRRAPTTVLTTDTTNFRAMVQEFTGIPAPPFTASSPFPRTRVLDLYGTPSSMRSNHHHHHLDSNSTGTSQPSYLRRPFPQKIQLPPPPPPFLASTSSSSQLSPSNATAAAASPPLINYQQLSPESSSLFNVPHPILTSLLQSNPPKPSPLDQNPSNDSRLKISSFLDDFGLGHTGSVNHTSTTTTTITTTTNTTLPGLPGLISPDQTIPPRNNSNENPPTPSPSITWGNGITHPIHHENDNASSHSHSKLNFSTSTSSSFPSDKASTDNAAGVAGGGGGGGMMESWICSSD